ncbi:alpha/beta hydrolase [Streptomyces sp. NPDC050560]|uniref:alpha/beta hydrolase n=1 Tax=Streptomyces sp. NPDC050560 TaxID=3365630 RepID=UPI0037B4DC4B
MAASLVKRLVAVVAAALTGAALAVVPASASATPHGDTARSGICRTQVFPVALPSGAKESISTQYCVPRGPARATNTVQVLVHGGTYNHAYWDFPYQRGKYSYVERANRLGYATVSLDVLGTGASSHPDSTEVTFGAIVETVHQVIAQVKQGALHRHYAQVMAVGHSFGSAELIQETAEHHDADALVLTGSGHTTSSFVKTHDKEVYMPANRIPRFSSLDDGYQASAPGKRDVILYYPPLADPRVVAYDAATEDVISTTQQSTRPASLISLMRQIDVPVLLVDGNMDNHYCTPDVDGATDRDLGCASTTQFYDHEAPNFTGTDCFSAMLVRSGHDINLHVTAPASYRDIFRWETATLPARATTPHCALHGALPTPGIPLS